MLFWKSIIAKFLVKRFSLVYIIHTDLCFLLNIFKRTMSRANFTSLKTTELFFKLGKTFASSLLVVPFNAKRSNYFTASSFITMFFPAC